MLKEGLMVMMLYECVLVPCEVVLVIQVGTAGCPIEIVSPLL